MAVLEHFDGPMAVRLVVTLLHFVWQGTLLALLAAAAARLAAKRSPSVRYAIFATSMLSMVAAVALTFVLVGPGQSMATEPAAGGHLPDVPTVGATAEVSNDDVGRNVSATPQPTVTQQPEPTGVDEKQARETTAADKPRTNQTMWRPYVPYVVTAYYVGAALMLLRLLVGLGGGDRLRRHSQPVEQGALLAAAARQARLLGLSWAPALAYSRRVTVPVVVGVIRPMILLPMNLATGLSSEQIEMILSHELAHVRRHDPLINVIQRLIEVLLFFHPALWYVSRQVRLEREHCCDDLVLGTGTEPEAYASSLVEAATQGLRRQWRQPTEAAACRATGSRSQLKHRVLRLLGHAPAEQTRLGRAWLAAWVLTAALAISAITALGRGASEPPTAEQDENIAMLADAARAEATEKRMAGLEGRITEFIEELRKSRAGDGGRWFGAVRRLVEIGGEAIPALCAEIGKAERPRTQSVLAFTLRAIGDVKAVPALIDALEKSGFSSDYGFGKADTDLAKFIQRHQMDPVSDKISLGRPVREITVALERLTGHSEGQDHFHAYDEEGNRLGSFAVTPEIRDRQRAHRKEVAQRWRAWWKGQQEAKSVEGGVVVRPEGSLLEFHVVPKISGDEWQDLTSAKIDELKEGLSREGPCAGSLRGDYYQWSGVDSNLRMPADAVTAEYEGKKYLLLAAGAQYSLWPPVGRNRAWGLQKAYATQDALGKPTVGFVFDKKGSELFYELTKRNTGRSLAILIDGVVRAAPTIESAIMGQGRIVGRFSEEEVDRLVEGLQLGMPVVELERGDGSPGDIDASILQQLVGTWLVNSENSRGSGNVRRMDIHPNGMIMRYEWREGESRNQATLYADQIIFLKKQVMKIAWPSGSDEYLFHVAGDTFVFTSRGISVVLEREKANEETGADISDEQVGQRRLGKRVGRGPRG